MIKIDYFISLNSPWTYLGSARFIALVAKYNVDVTVKPANFGEVFSQTGGLPLPKRSGQRQAYRMFELQRWRDELGIPIRLTPENFPSNETRGAHAIIATQLVGQDALRFSAEIGRSLWEDDQNIGDMAVLEAAGRRAGVDVHAVLAAAPGSDELEALWEANTRDAVDKGVFGAPSYRFEDGEIMWGQDRVHFVGKKLAQMAGGAT